MFQLIAYSHLYNVNVNLIGITKIIFLKSECKIIEFSLLKHITFIIIFYNAYNREKQNNNINHNFRKNNNLCYYFNKFESKQILYGFRII